jgi:hypothetical protein
MNFLNFCIPFHRLNPVKQGGSRKGTKNAFADNRLAAKSIARQQCRAWIETGHKGVQ